MTVRVYVHSDLQDFPDIQAIARDFAAYKRGEFTPDYFGRDGDYHDPAECRYQNVWHLHLCDTHPPSSIWTRTRNPFRRTSDKHLVYCSGDRHPDHFLLLTVLEPDAHRLARNIDRMLDIAKIARAFREQF